MTGKIVTSSSWPDSLNILPQVGYIPAVKLLTQILRVRFNEFHWNVHDKTVPSIKLRPPQFVDGNISSVLA